MKIFAIGLNYASHNEEMKSVFVSEEPVIFMKPDTALLKNGEWIFTIQTSGTICGGYSGWFFSTTKIIF
jgi:2-keto-4-pentenoate hydratase/2-oxohepta-3-ene-1,7-dioic acid hydratase in catechol pathway